MLFVGAKVNHLGLLPQGQPERESRVLAMMDKMQELGFGNCSNTGACSVSCPKDISFENIVRMNREYAKASIKKRD
jgi:succinate dehydrogenase / fumarate reductase iron-sulfur subunit